MPLTAIELEKLKTSIGASTRGVMENRAEVQRRINYIIKRTQDADLPYEEAINLSWQQICLFSQENVWYLIQHNRVTISQVKDWTGLHISTVAHPLITERLDHPDIVQWIDIISYKLTSIFQKPQITTLVQRHIIPWEALLELACFDE